MGDISAPAATPKWNSGHKTAPTWVIQCRDCKKWRLIQTQQEYEEIRENVRKVPFTCLQRKERVSCADLPDVELQGNMSCLWRLDKPNLPKSPPGFTRHILLTNNLSALQVYYEPPSGKILKRPSQVGLFLFEHPEYNHLSPADLNFKAPKIANYTNFA